MRKIKKITALLMCSALLISGTGVGIVVEKTQAASLSSDQKSILKTEAEETQNPELIETPPAEETQNPELIETPPVEETQNPELIETPPVEETQDPELIETPPAEETQQPTIPPVETVTSPPSITTDPGTGSSVSGTAVSVGDEITAGNYVYVVETVPSSDINYGTLKLTTLTEKAKTKATLNVPSTVTKDGITYRVTGIGARAFTTSTAVKTVIIRKYVTFVGVRAFQGLKTLQSVTIGENVTIIKKKGFAGCSALRTVTIPSKVKTIGVAAFYNCKKLKSVLIESKKITSIKKQAFSKNKSGRYFIVPSGKKSLYKSLLNNTGITVKTMYTY